MCEVSKFRKRRHESRYIRRGVEKRWVLFDEEVLHFPGSVFGRVVTCWSALVLDLWLVGEFLFCAGFGADDGWEEGGGGVGHVEGEGLDVPAYS